MNWFAFASNLVSRIPLEKVLFPRRDNVKALEEFAATMTAPVAPKEAPPEQKTTPTITQEPETVARQETVATACVPCALGHFSTSAGLLNEAVRFKGEGMTSNEILDRLAKTLAELNALERVDLTPEKIRSAPDWERDIAEEALRQSRSLRHRLENIESIEELEAAAADTEGYYRELNRVWWKQRFAKLGKTEPEMTLEEAKKMAAEEAAKQVEKKWQSQEKK
ncbi:hypothetical protein ES703_69962 [subsurface metagenome]